MSGAARIRKRDAWREKMIRVVAGILKDGEPSKFALEAHCRHSLRAHFCLQGSLWADAEQRAASIVTAALDRIYAVRPTWHEGQIEHVEHGELVERRYCVMCGARSGEDLVFTHGKYCSALCSHRAQGGERPCEHCGKVYQTYRPENRYCSIVCRDTANRTLLDRPCEVCGEIFRPRTAARRFCSTKCRAESTQKPRKACEVCGELFRPHVATTRFCSWECSGKSARKPRLEATCPICKSIFTVKRSDRPGKYCSKTCGAAAGRLARWNSAAGPAPETEDEPSRKAAE